MRAVSTSGMGALVVRLSPQDTDALDDLLDSGEATKLRRVSNSGREAFSEFLLDAGRFEWDHAAQAVLMLDGCSKKQLVRCYANQAAIKIGGLDDLAIVGGDNSLAGTVSSQLLNINKTDFRHAWGAIHRFFRQWDNVLAFTLNDRPRSFELLTDRIRDYARPKRRPTATKELVVNEQLEDPSLSVKEQLFAETTATSMGLIQRIAMSYEADPEVRHELIQDILLAIWVALASFRGDASIKTFAASIAQKRCITHVSRKSRLVRPEVPATSWSAADYPDETVFQNDRKRMLSDSIQSLPVVQREAIVLCLEGFSYSEMATMLNISENAAMLRCQRAKSSLKARLAQA